ncbi:MAG: hypothetical protein M3077_03865 [Candidatus Dormibacteraeota bacterium]|nr:hypothetical protein [Candidatus Dormibacteraeota bacterium]
MRWPIPARWWVVAGITVTAIVIGVILLHGSPNSSSSGVSTGALVTSIAQPATTGQNVSLDQFHGSKVVLYFYEGSG